MIVLDKFRGGGELVPGRELVHHHYRMARFPIQSGLNIDAWCSHLRNYSEKRLIQDVSS